jgi:hypothetical protein
MHLRRILITGDTEAPEAEFQADTERGEDIVTLMITDYEAGSEPNPGVQTMTLCLSSEECAALARMLNEACIDG